MEIEHSALIRSGALCHKPLGVQNVIATLERGLVLAGR